MAKKLKPVPINFPLSTSPGQSPQEAAGRLINCYAEPLGESSGVVYHRAPGCSAYGAQTGVGWNFWGLEVFPFNGPQTIITPTGVYRGGIFVNSILYAVFGQSLYTIVLGGSFTKIGAVPGTDKVFFARNNKAPVPDIAMVCQAGPFVVTSVAISAYPDANAGSPSCVVGHEGFFIFGYGNSDMLPSNVNSTAINTLNKARSETNPNGIIQLVSYAGQLYVMGSTSIEIWGDPVNPTGFPFNHIGYSIVPGLITDHAVTGFDPEFGQGLIYVATDHTVRWLADAANATKISSPDLDRLIKAAGSNLALEVSNINVDALNYIVDGVPFVQINGPTWSWAFNCLNSKWHERQSYLSNRSRLVGSVFAFDRWLCGDTLANGRMLEMTNALAKEINDPFIPVIESMPVEDFPINMACPRADFDVTPGTGIAIGHDPDETNPKAEISWSNDGGYSWSNPRFMLLGKQAKTMTRLTVWRTGTTGVLGRKWRVSVPPAVHFGLVQANMKSVLTEW